MEPVNLLKNKVNPVMVLILLTFIALGALISLGMPFEEAEPVGNSCTPSGPGIIPVNQSVNCTEPGYNCTLQACTPIQSNGSENNTQ